MAVEGAAAAEAAAAVGVDDVLESRVVAARAVAKALAIRLNLCLLEAVEDCGAVNQPPSERTFKRRVLKFPGGMLHRLAFVLDEVNTSDRYNLDNHSAIFPYFVVRATTTALQLVYHGHV